MPGGSAADTVTRTDTDTDTDHDDTDRLATVVSYIRSPHLLIPLCLRRHSYLSGISMRGADVVQAAGSTRGLNNRDSWCISPLFPTIPLYSV